jgi:alginate O-acetyltransferase complex protein AlgI
MLFNSYEFIFLFLPIALFGFFSVARKSNRMAALWLACVSLFFYGWWNPQYVVLLLASIGFNYAMGYSIGHVGKRRDGRDHRKKYLLTIAIGANLLLLGYFKYTNFFIGTSNDFLGTNWELAQIILPLGISFFTFTQVAFLVDVYRGIAREYSLTHYILFVSYFPHLIAGPVLHHRQMMPQFALPETYRLDWDNVSIGLTYFSIGLAKKVLLADSLSEYATPVFSAASKGGEMMLFSSWVGVIAYSFQLYFDFSGYSDMAVGLSKMFGVDLPRNFNSPYKAQNIIEFWKRWHMTLSQFLRDYLYISLGGNRHGQFRRYINLMLTMLLGGFWHGASWNFVVWGALHGGYLIINHVWRNFVGESSSRIITAAGIVVTYLAVTVAWTFFRADTLSAALEIVKGMAGINGISLPISLFWVEPHVANLPFAIRFEGLSPELATPVAAMPIIFWFSISSIIIWLLPNSQELVSRLLVERTGSRRMVGALFGCLFGASVLSFSHVSEFLYFQF